MKKRLAALLIALGLSAGVLAQTAPATTAPNAPVLNLESRAVKLNDGHTMPIIGLGVFMLDNQQAEAAVLTALKDGYRLIDTAHIYGNEEAVGRAIKQSGIPRNQIFLTTKLWTADFPRAAAEIDAMLKRLDTDYIDLVLLHHPAAHDADAYKAMEAAVKAGKIRSIGLSNYYEKEFADIMKTATIPPAVVQNETHPYNQWRTLKPTFARYGTVPEAWYPLGGRDRYGRGGTQTLFKDPTIAALAEKHHKTPAQIILRWHLQDGNVAIPGSANPKHIRENIDIFNFNLSDDDMAKIRAMDKQQRFSTF